MSVRASPKRLFTHARRSFWTNAHIRNAGIGVVITGILFGLGFAGTRTVAGGAVTRYIVTTVIHSDSGPSPSRVTGHEAASGALTDPTPSPVDVAPVVTPDPGAVVIGVPSGPVYPVVQGAPCMPPGMVVNGACVPSGLPPPPPPSPSCVDQPGAPCAQGAPCLPPGVITNGSCAVPQPTTTPTPIATPAAMPPSPSPVPTATPVTAASSPSPSSSPVPSP
jgi:hypothetical protein